MKSHYRHELSRALAACVDAAGSAPPSEQVDQAQDRLMARLRQPTAPARPDRHSDAATVRGAEPSPPLRARWLAAACMAALAIIVIAMPLPTQQGGAFAAVQAHFRNFQTLSMRVEQRRDGYDEKRQSVCVLGRWLILPSFHGQPGKQRIIATRGDRNEQEDESSWQAA